MFYCHDSYGLGHLRRTLTLANHIRASVPDMSQLIVTGSPVAEGFSFPRDTDYIKLPAITKNHAGEYEPRSLSSSLAAVRNMRRDILFSAAQHFQPDFLIVDHAPAGLKGEAVATLRHLKHHRPETKLIVGLRDVIDEAPKVRQAWARDGVYELLDDVYDLILVYGHRNFYDVVREYGLSPKAADKTRFVGYLGRPPGTRPRDEVRASLPMQTDKLVVVTAGGGGDGKELFNAMLQGLRRNPRGLEFDCLIVGGPLMSDADRSSLLGQLGKRSHVHFLDFTDDLTSYFGAADVVVSMGGYNSVCEILSLGRPSIIVPRATPRKEQLIRAEVLSRRGLIHMIHPRDLSPERLLGATWGLLADTTSAQPALPMDGLRNVMGALGSLMPHLPQAWDLAPRLSLPAESAVALA
ncbi:MAG: hypothetical protein H0W06_01710 [Chloroflexia bacterium]|nr:hypothetical protein [Chloroflexia bacterium]